MTSLAGLLDFGRLGFGQQSSPELVVVTGAGSGIGRATAAEFGARGSRVVCADINLESAVDTADAIPDGRGVARRLDVADPDEWERFGTWVRAEFGVPDVVVNNAGIGMGGAFLDHTAEDWRRIVDVNLLGVAHGCRVFGRQLAERNAGPNRRRGHLVNIASAAAYTPSPELPAYVATKAAVLMLSEALRAEMAGHDVGVSAICPGFISTNIYTATRFVGEVAADRGDTLKSLFERIAPGPELVARRIGSAVRYDVPVLPVTVGSWLAYGTYHLAPPLMRLATKLRADTLLRFAPIRPVSEEERHSTTDHSRVGAR